MKFKLHVTQECKVEADSLKKAKDLMFRNPAWLNFFGSDGKGFHSVKSTSKVVRVVAKR